MSQMLFLAAQTASTNEPGDLFADGGLTEIAGYRFNNNPISVWSGGALLTVEDAKSSAPIFRAFDKSGRQISQFEFKIEGAQRINIYSSAFARGFDGSLAIAGSAYTAIAGSAYTNDSRAAAFLAWVSPDGQKQTVIRLSPYFTRVVTVAADGRYGQRGTRKRMET